MMRSFDYLVDTDELDGVISYYSDNDAIIRWTSENCEANEAFHVSEGPMLMLTFPLRGV